MIDLHCHILPGVDDGAPDLATAIDMARILTSVGFDQVAASPHFGEGPGGDVRLSTAHTARQALQQALDDAAIPLRLLANAEHHVTPLLFERIQQQNIMPIGSQGRWLLVELPWQGLADAPGVLFRLQAMGYKLLLAHPERYQFMEAKDALALTQQGVCLQLELGSFVGVYGKRAQARAAKIARAGAAHVLASDLHRARGAHTWLTEALDTVRAEYGAGLLQCALTANPEAILSDAPVEIITSPNT